MPHGSPTKKGKGSKDEDEGFSQAAHQKKMEERLPGGKRLKRLPVLRLDLGSATAHTQMTIINDNLYKLNDPIPEKASHEFQNWREIDKELYGDARAAYDGTISPFQKQPRVYKLESIKEKVWEGTRDKSAELAAKAEKEYLERAKKLAERKEKMAAKKLKKLQEAAPDGDSSTLSGMSKAQTAAIEEAKAVAKALEEEKAFEKPPMTVEDELETHLDPFVPPKPWKQELYKGDVVWINDDTRERLEPGERPVDKWPEQYEQLEIWREKLEMLQQLTPRADMNGYDYRETDIERRRRQRTVNDFEEAMKEEIQRREENPTDIEVIEDVLFDMVDILAKREEQELKRIKKAEKVELMKTWSLICRPYRMKPLPGIEDDDGNVEQEVTDLDFADMIISWSGHMLALFTPPGFYKKHDKERAEAKAIADEEAAF